MQAKGEDLWEVLTPVGCSEWKVRFSPIEAGTYRFFVEVEDGNNGDNLKTGIRSFAVASSDRPGFVRISKSDPKYFEFTNGGDVVGLIPTRYPDTVLANGDALALSRQTDWRETAPGVYIGLGQRLITTDNAEFALMDLRSVVLESAAG